MKWTCVFVAFVCMAAEPASKLPAKPSRELKANLACLQDCVQENPVFRRDLARLKKLAPKRAAAGPGCCVPAERKRPARQISA